MISIMLKNILLSWQIMLLCKSANNYYIYDYFIFKTFQVSKKMKKITKTLVILFYECISIIYTH
jgi:hypothetical protein